MNHLRSRAGFLAPGFCAALFSFIRSDQPLLDRCLSAAAAGVAMQLGTLLGAVVCMHFAARLTGERDAAPRLLDETVLLGAMLLATAMWMWWQVNREDNVKELAACVDQVALDDPLRPSQAVRECWRDRASRAWIRSNNRRPTMVCSGRGLTAAGARR